MTLDYERIDDDALLKAIRLNEGEHLLVLQPFGWHLDAKHMPNQAEHFERDGVIANTGHELVCEYGPYVAIVRKKVAPSAPAVQREWTVSKVCLYCGESINDAAIPCRKTLGGAHSYFTLPVARERAKQRALDAADVDLEAVQRQFASPPSPVATGETTGNDEPTQAQMSCGFALYGPPALCTCGTCPAPKET